LFVEVSGIRLVGKWAVRMVGVAFKPLLRQMAMAGKALLRQMAMAGKALLRQMAMAGKAKGLHLSVVPDIPGHPSLCYGGEP